MITAALVNRISRARRTNRSEESTRRRLAATRRRSPGRASEPERGLLPRRHREHEDDLGGKYKPYHPVGNLRERQPALGACIVLDDQHRDHGERCHERSRLERVRDTTDSTCATSRP